MAEGKRKRRRQQPVDEWIRGQRTSSGLLNQPDVTGWLEERAGRENPAYGNSGPVTGSTRNGPIATPGFTVNPDGSLSPTGRTAPSSLSTPTSGAGRVDAAANLPKPKASSPAPGIPPGMTPELGRQMLREGAAYMRDMTASWNARAALEAQPPGFFEERFTDKVAGKQIDSMVESGTHWLSELFDTSDDKDLTIAGRNVSGVETVWDGFWAGFGTMIDTVSWGASGALLAANPHYWKNRDQGQLGNLWQDATMVSPGRALQALASPVQDVLGEKPSAILGPLAGPLAPVYDEVLGNLTGGEKQGVYSHIPEFDITEQTQRDSWFDNTPQKIGSGLADAVVGLALDPTIAGGKALQLARLRFLGRAIKGSEDTARFVNEMDQGRATLDNIRTVIDPDDPAAVPVTREIEDLSIDEVMNLNVPEPVKLAHVAVARTETAASAARRASIEAIEDADERAARLADFTPEYTKVIDEETLYARLQQLDVSNRDAVSAALYNAKTFEQASLVLRHTAGDLTASQALDTVAPALYRHVLNGERALIEKMVRADPRLVTQQANLWADRYEMVAKRLDELEELRADPTEIAKTRAVLEDISDQWEFARNALSAPVGAGPRPSAAEIDLLRRSIDDELKGNYLFERSLREASGEMSDLYGVMNSRTKGFAAFAEGLDPESRIGQFGQAIDNLVAKSRMNRAGQAAAADQAGSFVGALKAGWRKEFFGIDKTKPVAVVFGAPNLAEDLNPLGKIGSTLSVGSRYLWTERPSGMIHTAGVGAEESSREIRAVVRSVPLYQGAAVAAKNEFGNQLYRLPGSKAQRSPLLSQNWAEGNVVVGKDSSGRWRDYRTGKTVKVKDEAALEALTVGGKERGRELVQAYLNAMLAGGKEGQRDVKKVLDAFEEEMLGDIAAGRGLSIDGLRSMHYRQNRRLEKIEMDIKKDTYWIEEGDTTRKYAPWLETHLQNATFLKNWAKIDEMARYKAAEMAKDGNKWAYTTTSKRLAVRDFALDMDAMLQDVWRPMVLLRLGYPIRNVLEGQFRSTAFLFSLAPLTRAAEQAGISTAKTVGRITGSHKRAAANVAKAEQGQGIEAMSPAMQRWHANQTASIEANITHTSRLLTEHRINLAAENAVYRDRRVAELNDRYAHILRASSTAREEVDRVVALAFPDESDLASAARAQAVIDMNSDRLVDLSDEMQALSQMTGGRTALTPEELRQMDTLDYLEYSDLPYYQMQREVLEDPQSAALLFQTQTMAHRRVYGRRMRHLTDTDTMGTVMRGRALNDPFDPEDPYAAIALQNLSADHTMRQTAAMRLQAETDWMALRETRYYTAVEPGTPQYWNGVATALNQVQNSKIGQIVIKGRAEGIADDEIVDQVVRFLYETDDGALIGAFLNEANGAPFYSGKFIGVQKQAQKAMLQRVKDTDPLYIAAEQTRADLRQAYGVALNVRGRLPKPRFEGDTAVIPRRRWEGDTFGQYEVSTSGRGNWTVTNRDTGVSATAGNRRDARALAKELQAADDDATRAHWSMEEPLTVGGREFRTEADVQAYLDEMQAARMAAVAKYEEAFNAPLDIPGNGARFNVGSVDDPANAASIEDARLYAAEVLHRYDVMTAGDEALQKYLYANPQLPIGGKHHPKAAENVVKGFLDGKDNLQPVIGNIAELVGYSLLKDDVQRFTQRAFKVMGTIPEDALVRAPFYGKVYRDEAARAYDVVAGQVGAENVTMDHVNAIKNAAHRRALKDTKQWLYTIDRRTAFADAMEKIVPFTSATQNSVTTIGRLIWHDPAIPAVMAKIWQAPDKAGWTEDGDIVAVPSGFIPGPIRDALGIDDQLRIGKKSIDLILNGVVDPSATPWMAVASSELMKNSLFGMYTSETPPWLSWMGETGDFLWQEWKDFTLGEGMGASQLPGSLDKFLSPWLRRGWEGFILGAGSSTAFGNTYNSIVMSEAVKQRAGQREGEITHEEAIGRTIGTTIARMFGSLVLPFAPKYDTGDRMDLPEDLAVKLEAAGLSDFKTIGDAMRANDKAFYEDQGRIAALEARQRAGEMIDPSLLEPRVQPSEELFGDAIWRAYKMRSRENTAGLPATTAASKFARENTSMLEKVAPTLDEEGMLDVIGMFSQNPDDLYDPNAQAWFMANDIPGTGETFGTVSDPIANRRAISVQEGWKVYMRGLEALELDMMRKGILNSKGEPSFDLKAATEWDHLRQDLESAVAGNYPGWLQSKQSVDQRSNMTASVIETALNDETFAKTHASDPVWRKGGYADIYVTERKRLVQSIKAVRRDMEDNGLTATSKAAGPWRDQIAALQARWAAVQGQLRRASPSWAAIQDRYLGDDDAPGATADFEATEREAS